MLFACSAPELAADEWQPAWRIRRPRPSYMRRLQQTSKRNVTPPPRTLASITMGHNISFNKILFIITIITYPPHSHTHKQYLRYKIEFIIFNKNLYEG